MAESRTGTGRARREGAPEGDGRLAGSVFWVAAVVGTLVLGFALQTDPPAEGVPPPPGPEPRAAIAVAPPPAVPVPEVDPPPPAPPPPIPSGPASRMAERAMKDARRLASGGGDWTAQLAVLCEPSGAEAFVVRAGDDARVYVLPAELGDRSCFRVCWGRFSSESEARAARIPSSLRDGAKPAPRRVAEVLP